MEDLLQKRLEKSEGEKRFLFTANYSVIEPLFALHLLGVVRDEGHTGTFFPVRKYDYDSLFRRAEEWGATDVGFNVYSGNHVQVYKAAEQLSKMGKTVHIGGPHATYFDKRSANFVDWVFKGQSYESFASYLRGPEAIMEHFGKTTFEMEARAKVNAKMAQFIKEEKSKPPKELVDEWQADADVWGLEQATIPAGRKKVMDNLASRIFFSKFLTPKIPNPDRATFYADNEDMRLNPIKNSIGGEGCLFKCKYCYNVSWNSPEMYGAFERRTLRDVDEHIEELADLKNYNTELIYFQDDVFALEMDWLEEFTVKYKEKVGIPYHAQLRLELANDDKGIKRLQLMKEGGCSGVTVAVEHGDYEIREKVLDRAMKDRHVFTGLANIKKYIGPTRTEQMLGVFRPDSKPGDSMIDEDLKTTKYNCLARVTYGWSAIFAAYGGVDMGEMAADLGLYPREKLETNDDLRDSFFDETALDYHPDYKIQVRALQRFFGTLVHTDRGYQIAEDFLKEDLLKHNRDKIEDFLVVAKDLGKFTKLTLYDNALYKTKDEQPEGTHDSLEGCRPTAVMEPSGVSGTNDKRGGELLTAQRDNGTKKMTLEDLANVVWNSQQRQVYNNLKPLWKNVPRSEVVADKLLRSLPNYTQGQRNAFIDITEDLYKTTERILARGPLDVQAEIDKILEYEEKRFNDEKEAKKCSA